MIDLVEENKEYVLNEIADLAGKERAERLKKLFAMKKTGEKSVVDPYADFISSQNAYAAYVIFSGKPYLLRGDDLEKKVLEVYNPEADTFGKKRPETRSVERDEYIRPTSRNENFTANIAQSIIGLVLAWNGGDDMEELIMQRLYAMHRLIYEASRNYKEPTYKFGRDAKELLSKAVNHSGSTPASRGEACLRLCYLLYKHGFSWDSTEVEAETIRAVTYRIDSMNEFSQKCESEYLRLLKGNKYPLQNRENEYALGVHIRHFDGSIKDYEKIFGMTKEKFLEDLLVNYGTATLAHRMLRAFFTSEHSSREFMDLCEKCMTKREELNNFRFYHTCEEMYSDAQNALTDSEFFEKYDAVIEHLEPIFDNDVFITRRAMGPMAGVFSIFFVRGWDVKKLVERLGERNICRYSLNNKPSYNVIENGDYGINVNDLEDIFYSSFRDVEDVIFYYFNTIMHKVVDFRSFIERVANKTNGNVKEALADYSFRGEIVRLDAKLLRKGFYNVEPYNLKIAQGYEWMEIQNAANAGRRGDSSVAAIDDKEQYRRCKLTLMSDEWEVDNSAGNIRFIGSPKDKVDFKISFVEKKEQTYKDCYIYIRDMKKVSKDSSDRTEEANAALDGVRDYLKKVIRTHQFSPMYEAWKKNGNERMTPVDIIRLAAPSGIRREGERNNRAQEFAMLILEACEALRDNKSDLKKLLDLLQENFIDEVNEFFYKPGMVKQTPYIRFDNYKRIIELANSILNSGIPFELKMRVYMNTCLKTCYFLEKYSYCDRLEKSQNPFLYNEDYQYTNYAFLLKPNHEQPVEEEYSFSFATNIKSNYGNNIVISKQKADECGVTSVEGIINVFGEIDYIDTAKGRIVLKSLVPDSQNLKQEAWSVYIRKTNELNDIRTSYDLREAIENLRNEKIKVEPDAMYARFLNQSLKFMMSQQYEPEMVATYFTSWKGWIEKEEEMFAQAANQEFIDKAKLALQKLIERAGSEDDIFVRKTIKNSYFGYLND